MRIQHTLLTSLVAASSLHAACLNPLPPEGTIACTPGEIATCPAGWTCRIDAYCYREALAPSELCTTSEGGAEALDEDADGAIDEGCDYYFGTPHPVMAVVSSIASGLTETAHPTIAAEGDVLTYITNTTGFTSPRAAEIRTVTRSSRSAPFGAPRTTAIEGLASGSYVQGISVSASGLIAVVAYDRAFATHLVEVTRASTSEPWSRPTAIVDASDPALSADGLELFYRSGEFILRVTRSRTSIPWGTPSPVGGLPMNAGGPSLTPDGHALFFHAGTPSRIYVATRPNTQSDSFSAPMELSLLRTESVRSPAYNVATRELFFVSDRAFTPSRDPSIWRVQVCRDSACTEGLDTEQVRCEGGSTSADGLHCYRTSAPMTFADAQTWCAGLSGHLATVHSDAELALVPSASGDAWLGMRAPMGAWVWLTSEPVSYQRWFVSEPAPMSDLCVASNRGAALTAWGTRDCATTRPAVCETELWPIW